MTTASAPVPPAEPRRPRVPRPTLWMRVVVVLAGFVSLTTLCLFVGVDHFVSARFARLHTVRVTHLVADIQSAVDGQLAQMAGTAGLLVNDADLVNSTYYHLYLEGGKEQPRAAVDRIARSFHVDSVTLWDMEGNLVAASGSGPESLVLPGGEGVRTAVIRLGDEVWLVAVATLTHGEDSLAQIQLARPLTGLLDGAQGFGVGAVVRVAGNGPPPPGVIRVPLAASGDSAVDLDIAAPDEVNLAVTDVKRLLALVMAVFGVLLVVGIAVFLRRLFRPVIDLISAALAVGRGEFGQTVVAHRGRGEVARLVDAFNQMSDGLRRLRALEREVQHREQLSAIGRVAARVAHDLNNPLTVISNVARLAAARTDIDGDLAADLRLVVHHCERSITTIEALLAYGRPVRLRRQQVDLAPLCEGVVRRWSSRFPDVAVAVAASAPLVALADPYRVEQVLDNLLDNARAFGRRIEVALGADDDMAFVRVADDGPGFSPEAREHAFEPFFTTRTGGTGLGLASCLAIARGHGGDLDIESGPPAAVTLWLPLAGQAGEG